MTDEYKLVCLTCGNIQYIDDTHPASKRLHDDVALRASCELCYKPTGR